LGRLWRAIRSGAYEVVDAHNPQSQFWGLCAATLARAPIRISTVHSEYALADGSSWKRLLYVGVLCLNHALGYRFIAVSAGIARSVRALGAREDKVAVNANGLALNWSPSSTSPGLRAELGWTDAAVVGVVARLVPIKGHAYLLEAFARLRGAWPNLRGLLIGDGAERERLTELAATLELTGIIHFAGHRSDVGSLYRECDVVCLPSEIEGLPFAALEAASFGITLVATAVGDVPEFFEHGTSARLAPARDAAALAAELEWCLANPKQARLMGEAARAMLHRRLSQSG
jgi:glycosyltransferase involved in cell wall biosynthesis